MYNIVHSPLNDINVQNERMITIQNLKAKIDGLGKIIVLIHEFEGLTGFRCF